MPSLIHSYNIAVHRDIITNINIYMDPLVLQQVSHHSNVAELKCKIDKKNSLAIFAFMSFSGLLKFTCILAMHIANCLLSTKTEISSS